MNDVMPGRGIISISSSGLIAGDYTRITPTSVDKNDIIDEIMKRIKHIPKMKSLSCLHCGATLEMAIDDHIVKCQYCGGVYAIDTEMIRDVREEII